MADETAQHYARLAATYDDHWAYSPDYIRHFSHAIADTLRLTRSDAIADIGCGTGLYTRQLYEDLEPVPPMLCVEPVQAMLDQLPASPGLRPVLASAEDLVAGRVTLPTPAPLDAIIIKEAIHHITSHQDTLTGLAELLSSRGRLLIVMLPRAIHHPLFQAAHERFQESQPDPDEIREFVRSAGLRASVTYRTFHVVIERDRYVRMLQSRYMSVLDGFSAGELSAGIEQFRRSYRDPILRFDDHFAFVKGHVPPA